MAAGAVLIIFERRISGLKRARAVQEAFSRELIASQENERKRIAAELHDSLGQSLLVVKNRAQLGRNRSADPDAALKQFDEIGSTVSHALEEVRTIAHNLRPYQLDRLGLTMAIEAIINKVAASSEVRFNTYIDKIDGLLPPESEINFYRVVQEAVNNIIKHSEATQAQVRVELQGASIHLTIQDNGKGFVLDGAGAAESQRRGFGLTGISERARILGGSCVIKSAPGKGAEISIQIDLESKRRELFMSRRPTL